MPALCAIIGVGSAAEAVAPPKFDTRVLLLTLLVPPLLVVSVLARHPSGSRIIRMTAMTKKTASTAMTGLREGPADREKPLDRERERERLVGLRCLLRAPAGALRTWPRAAYESRENF